MIGNKHLATFLWVILLEFSSNFLEVRIPGTNRLNRQTQWMMKLKVYRLRQEHRM